MSNEMTSEVTTLEQKRLKHFVKANRELRNESLIKFGIEPVLFDEAIAHRIECDKINEKDDADLDFALKDVRNKLRVPRLGKQGRQFMLRHYEVTKRLLDKGASIKEIALYLENYRKFKISVGYLQKLLKSAGDM